MRSSMPLLIAAVCALSACPNSAKPHTSIQASRNAGHESAARTHDAFNEDFRKAGNDEKAEYHAEQAKQERKKIQVTCSLRRGCTS